MQIKLDIGAVYAGIPDSVMEVRGLVTQDAINLLLIARPKQGDYAGKVVVFNMGQAVVEILDPKVKEHAEVIDRIKLIPPASVTLSSIDDAEYVPVVEAPALREEEPSAIIVPPPRPTNIVKIPRLPK